MQINVYQNYYLEEQKQYLDKAFIPFNNTENKEPELREYPILKKLQQENANDDLYWGLVSWRWYQKVKINGTSFIKFIENNPGYDLYHINHDDISTKKLNTLKNVFMQGEVHHKGMRKYFLRLIEIMGLDIKINQQLDQKYFITCHFYVMHSSFWNKWINFLDRCLQTSYNDEPLNYYLRVETTSRYGKRIPNFSFVVERLIVMFCLLENLNVIEYQIQRD